MTEPRKVWNKHKITAIVIMLIAIAFVSMVFIESNTTTLNNPKSLEKSITKFTSSDEIQAKVIQIDENENELIVSFTDERYPDFMGIARFQSMFGLLWKPVETSYGNGLSIDIYQYIHSEDPFLGLYQYRNGEDKKIETIVYGINADSRISYFKGADLEREILPEQKVNEPNFIKYYDVEEPIYELELLDADRNNITLEFYKELDHSGPTGVVWSHSGSIGSYLIIFLISLILAALFWKGDSNPMRYYEERVHREEKKISQGFADKLENLSLLKKIALFILVVSILATGILYPLFFSASLSEDSLTKSIEKYTDESKVTILKTEKDGKNLIVLYKTENNEPYSTSIALFERGIIGRWAIVRSDSQQDICISSFGYYHFGDSYHVIVTGTECDPRAVSYEFIFEHPYDTEMEPISFYSGNITEPNFIHIYKKDNYWPGTLKIYDLNGKNIQPELFEKYNEETNWSTHGTSSITFGMNFFVVLVVIINLLVIWAAWIEKPKKKDE